MLCQTFGAAALSQIVSLSCQMMLAALRNNK